MADNKKSFRYDPLQPGSIRILELLPRSPRSQPTCRLVSRSISEPNLDYYAISYVWGDPARDQCLECGDQTLWVTANLLHAVTAFCRHDMLVRVWADAVCINQDDLKEREAQVSMMGLIFRNSRRVLASLGPDLGGEARIAMDFILEFNQSPQKHCDEARSMIIRCHQDSEIPSVPTRAQKWAAIKQLFQLPFFHRVWIIQELGLAAEARLFWGQHEIQWTEVGNFVRWLDAAAADIVTHLQLESWVAAHTHKIWGKNADGTPRFNFFQVLHWARVHKATDPRDRVYAFLSHPSSLIAGTPLMRPNYNLTTNQVYASLAATLIQQTKSLHILHFVDHETQITTDQDGHPIPPPLPSWAPNWHAQNLVAPLPRSSAGAESQETDPRISILQDGKLLIVRGLLVDTIATASSMLTQHDIPIGTHEAELRKQNPLFLDHLWDLCHTSRPLQEALDGISLSLVGQHRAGQPIDTVVGKELDQHRADFAAYVVEYNRLRGGDEPLSLVDQLPPVMRQEFDERAGKGSATRFVQDATWVAMSRVVFLTAQRGYIGLGPRFVGKDDVCCRVAGSGLLLVLRPVAGQVDATRIYTFLGPAVMPGYDMAGIHAQGAEVEEIRIM